jgi:hypothetical protein
MDPIRPIGPLEHDLEPVVRVTRTSPDARKERRDPREDDEPRPAPPQRPAPPGPPPDDENGTSLIDVRV